MSAADLSTRVGSVVLSNPVTTASGTSGHGAELAAYFDLSALGAVVVKSLAAGPWPGNPRPRLHPLASGMLNSVGLQGSGVAAWLGEELPPLLRAGATVVASIWGRTVQEYRLAAELLAAAPPGVVAVEVNVSCPNLEEGGRMFGHSPSATAAAVAAAACGRPRWAKLSAGTPDLVAVAGAALEAGAEALTLVNTLPAMAIDLETRRPALGAGAGGLSGAPLHAVAVRAVYECRAAFREAGICGVGGVRTGGDAVELLLAGADAVQVGTAVLADPRAPLQVLQELRAWCERAGVGRLAGLVGAAQQPRTARRDAAGSAAVPPPALPGKGPVGSGTARARAPVGEGGGRQALRSSGDPPAGRQAAARERLVLALDLADLGEARALAARLRPWFSTVKVGLELWSAAGPEAIEALRAERLAVFADLKLHDIPTTVSRAGRVLGGLGVRFVTLHLAGGAAMVEAGTCALAEGAAAAGLPAPVALGVTVLTSEHVAGERLLAERARLAAGSGCGGVVCAAADLPVVRLAAPDLLTVVPGIRLDGGDPHDQGRAATPREALAAGASLLVIGRAVTAAAAPEAAAAALAASIVTTE